MNLHRTAIVLVATTVVAAAVTSLSCSETTDGVTPDASATSLPDGAASEAGPGPGIDGGDHPDVMMVTASEVLLNEIAAGQEWIELVASGATASDVSGFRVADSQKDGGGPKLTEAVTFPAGTVLSPKSYLIVQGGGLDGGGKACPDGGQSYCFNAEFGVSNKSGETIYLVDKAGNVVGTAVYPPMGAPSGATWGRLPSGDPKGAFAITKPTPGAANEPQ